ncbi:hypothetical protein EJV47_18220 [Hymenobacter gummosus]|uniref:TonB C-terminal domain-containing protein n=1 Tax=Hymenobacter gummosus TaxID=1776032 RepID=A0A431TZI9_9BACT|nr:hypothetical protein [Hymenobacter gummosus]RTQ47855.1 hypothetical protein EJV47_18220 [Hymenobacter gummosus]
MRHFAPLLLALLLALPARGQQAARYLFLQVYQPLSIDQRLLPLAPPLGPEARTEVAAALTGRLQQLGFTVLTDRAAFRQLAAGSYHALTYAEVLCRPLGSRCGVTVLVHDSLNNVLLRETETRATYPAAARALATHGRFELRYRGLIPALETANPQLPDVDGLGLLDYAADLFRDAKLSRRIQQQGLALELHVDEVGLLTLQCVAVPADLSAAQQELIGRALAATPRWRPAYAEGRRVARSFRLLQDGDAGPSK